MDIELKKETVAINETLVRDNAQILLQSDIIVPDIKSDMAKILQIDSRAMVESVVSGDKKADITGSVNLTIVYVPEGDTRPVCSIITDLPFSAQIENPHITVGSRCIVCADAYHVEFSMLNSRKLSVKIVLDFDIRCIQENGIDLICDISSEEPVEKRGQSFEIYSLVHASNNKIGLQETLDFPSGKPGAASILKADAKVCDKDMRLIGGKIVVKGSVGVLALYVSDANTIEFMEHEIPFTEVIEADGADENAMCELDIDICKLDFSLRPDSDGDMRLLDVDILMQADVLITKSANMSAVSDCFCQTKKLICETKDFCFDKIVGSTKLQEAMKTAINLPEGAPELLCVYNLVTKPYISEVEIEKGKVFVSGVVDCYLLYLSTSTSPLSTQKAQIKFKLPMEIEGLCEECDCDVNIEVIHQSYNITMSGEIEVRISVMLDAKAIKKECVSLVTDVFMDADAPLVTRNGIVIYFVRPNDTIWKIAKRYNVSPELIAKLNGLENPDIINVGQRLLIPSL